MYQLDNLAKEMKPIGDSFCPPNIRRAKHKSRDIPGRFNEMLVGDEDGIADISLVDNFS